MPFNSLWRLMIGVSVAILGSIIFPSISSAELQIDEVLSKLDAHYYYPQENGLIRISARVEWEQRDMSSSNETYLKNPGFRFNGEFKRGLSNKGFEIDEGTVILSDDEKIQYLRILNNYVDAFLPKTLHETLSNYSGKIISAEKRKILLQFESSDPLEAVKGYGLTVDPDNWRLHGIQVRQEGEPQKVEGKFKYTRKGGKWAIVETMSNFTMGGHKYSEKMEFMYKKFISFWLVHKVKQTVKQKDKLILSYRFRLVDYIINSGN